MMGGTGPDPTDSSLTELFRLVPCPLCGSDQSRDGLPIDRAYASRVSGLDLAGQRLRTARCRACGHQYIQPMPQPAFLRRFYASYMAGARTGFYRERAADEIPPGFRQRYAPWLERLQALRSGPRLLDVGCGLGMFLRLAREFGFDGSGIEPDTEAAATLRERFQIPCQTGMVEEFATNDRYDAVTLWDLLEHLADPISVLRRTAALLVPGGLLVLEIPVRDSFIHLLVKAIYYASAGTFRRPLYRVYGVHHLQYFTSASIQSLLTTCGYTVLECHRAETEVEALHFWRAAGAGDRLRNRVYNQFMHGAFAVARGLHWQNKLVVFARAPGATSGRDGK